MAEKWWYICDEGICLYSQEAVDRMTSDPVRCIKHGAILQSDAAFDGKSRSEVNRLRERVR